MLPIGRRALCAAAVAAAAGARSSAAGARVASEAASARVTVGGPTVSRPFSARGFSSKRSKKKPATERKRLIANENKAPVKKEEAAALASVQAAAVGAGAVGGGVVAAASEAASSISASRLEAISRVADKVLGSGAPKASPKSAWRHGKQAGKGPKAAKRVAEPKLAKPPPEPSPMTKAAMHPKATTSETAKVAEAAAKADAEAAAKANAEAAAKAGGEPTVKVPEPAPKAKDEPKVAAAVSPASVGAAAKPASVPKASPSSSSSSSSAAAPKASPSSSSAAPPPPPTSSSSSSLPSVRSIALWSLGGGAAYLALTSDDPLGDAKTAGLVSVRILRDARAFVLTCGDYYWSLRGLEEGSPELAEASAACHRRGAQRLLDLCVSNGGTYVKMGQHVGMMDHVIPDAYVDLLRARLLDRCPASPFSRVRAEVERELGRPLEEVFETFEERPLASASLAQVHRAVLKKDAHTEAEAHELDQRGQGPSESPLSAASPELPLPAPSSPESRSSRARAAVGRALGAVASSLPGWLAWRGRRRGDAASSDAPSSPFSASRSREVAVKIQHAGLSDSLDADVAVVRALVRLAGSLFPSFQMDWLVQEIDQSMRQELDFLREADNLERCAADLETQRLRGVQVPRVHRSLSTPKLLTMDFVRGVGASDREALARLGVSPADVAARLRATFDAMAFRTGWLHCDPHPANLRVVRLDGRQDPLGDGRIGDLVNGEVEGDEGRRTNAEEKTRKQEEEKIDHDVIRADSADSSVSSISRASPAPVSLPRARSSEWALVLLDHGQYRELSPELRRAWAGLWHGLVVADPDEVERSARGLGAGDKSKLFVSVITRAAYDELFGQQQAQSGAGAEAGARARRGDVDGQRTTAAERDANVTNGDQSESLPEPRASSSPSFEQTVVSEVAAQRAREADADAERAASASASSASPARPASRLSRLLAPLSSSAVSPAARLHRREDDPERRARLAAFAREQAGEIAQMLGELPRPVLLLLKTNECLRAVDRELGQPSTSMLATARDAARALAADRAKEQGRWAALLDRARVEVRLALFAATIKARSAWDTLWGKNL